MENNVKYLFDKGGVEDNSYLNLQPRNHRLPCKDCDSSDALSIYLNKTKKGNWCYQATCFSCGKRTLQKDFRKKGYDKFVDITSGGNFKPTDEEHQFFNENKYLEVEEIEVVVSSNGQYDKPFDPMEGFVPDNNYRGVKPTVFEKYHASVRYDNEQKPDEVTHVIYPYFSRDHDQVLTAQKVRILARAKQDNGLYIQGKVNKCSLFGQNAFSASNSNKYIVITEGELDAMSAYQMLGEKYPCVSIKNGCESLVADVKRAFDYINSFDEIRVCCDPDEAGNEAVKRLCESSLIPYGKLKIMRLAPSIGDVNDYLTQGRQTDFTKAFWNAQDYQPEGVVLSSTMLQTCLNPPLVNAYEYPFSALEEATYGMRLSEFDVIGARSGIGKTSILKEFTLKILQETTEKVGLVLFEESTQKTLRSLVGMSMKKRIDLPGVSCREDEFTQEWERLGLHENRLALWDVQVNSWELDPIIKHIEFMVATQDIKFLFVDFLQCIKLEEGSTEERMALDRIAETFAKLAVRKNIHITSTTQLNRSTGEIRGSSGIEQFSHKIVYLERDKKHKDERMRRVTRLTLDKNRFNGTTGPCGFLEFNTDTGRLDEALDIDDDMFEGKESKK